MVQPAHFSCAEGRACISSVDHVVGSWKPCVFIMCRFKSFRWNFRMYSLQQKILKDILKLCFAYVYFTSSIIEFP